MIKTNLQWSQTEQLGNDWRLPSINEARNYAINLCVSAAQESKDLLYKDISTNEVSPEGLPLYVSLLDFSVNTRVYSPLSLLCKGEHEDSPPDEKTLLTLYSTRHIRGHSSYAVSQGATVNDCIITFSKGVSLFDLGCLCRSLGRDTAMQVIHRFDWHFIDRLALIVGNDFHGSRDEAMERLEDAQIARKLGWCVYEYSIGVKYGMTHSQAANAVNWEVNQADYVQMLVNGSGNHSDVERIMSEPDNEFNIELFFITLHEEALMRRLHEQRMCNTL